MQINAHTWDEIDTPEFWAFVAEAVQGFQKFTELTELKPEDHMPWKKLGQRWHFLRKGFSPGKPVQWEVAAWEELYAIAAGNRARRAVPVEQPGAGAFDPARPERSMDHDHDQTLRIARHGRCRVPRGA